MKPVSRYHPLLVTLHWLLAVLIVAMLAIGFFVLATVPNSDPRKIGILLLDRGRFHITDFTCWCC